MIGRLLCVSFAICSAGPACLLAQQTDETSEPLFNGKDLTGWVLVNTPPSTWTVQDGMLVCSGKPIGEIRTERMYQNFVLELEWRHMVPGGNAGVFLWADDITARGVPFHRSIEVQVLENAYGESRFHTTHGDIFPIHGAVMVPDNGRGGSRAFPLENRSRPSPEWNHYRITCIDGTVKLEVNGKQVTSGHDCSPRKGYLCLESEGGVVHYRNLRIRELPGDAVDPSRVAVANRGFRSIYSGLDLQGWESQDPAPWSPQDWVLKLTAAPGTAVPARLWSTERTMAPEFIVDVRLTDADSRAFLAVGSDGAAATPVWLEGHPEIAACLEPTGNWNRIECRVDAGQLRLAINGKAVPSEATPTVPRAVSEPVGLVLGGHGVVEFANMYVRSTSEP